MSQLLSAAARRLTDTLGELKARVREAIAGETGRAVAEAVRLAVTHAWNSDLSDDADLSAASRAVRPHRPHGLE